MDHRGHSALVGDFKEHGCVQELEQTDRLVLKQRGGSVVFLESNDDFEIIAQRWFFNEGEDIWFQPADSYEKARAVAVAAR